MAIFAYVARDAEGQRVTGKLAAASRQSVLAELAARELAPISLKALQERPLRRRVRGRHLATAYRQLADLLAAGVPLLRGLRLLARGKASPRLAEVFAAVADSVAGGERLADAMVAHGEVFPPVHAAMVRAGERGGFLEQALARMGALLEHQADLRTRVVGNLIYPVVLLVFSALVVSGALVFFVPRFEPFFARMDVPLPTRMVLGTSALLTRFWPLLLGALVVLTAGASWLSRRPRVRRLLAAWQLRIPRLGTIVANLAVARFGRLLGTLLANGVPMLTAMQIARDAAGNALLEEAIDRAAESVRSGENLAPPLAASGLFAEDVVEMISVGEAANNLPDVLTSIADAIERRVDRTLSIFVRLMEPAMLLLLGGVVMFIYLALVVPMMRMSAALSGG